MKEQVLKQQEEFTKELKKIRKLYSFNQNPKSIMQKTIESVHNCIQVVASIMFIFLIYV